MPRIELEIDSIKVLSPSTSKDMKAVGDDIKTLRDYLVNEVHDKYVTDNLDKDIKNLSEKYMSLKKDIERVQGQDVAPIAELNRKVEGAWIKLNAIEDSLKKNSEADGEDSLSAETQVKLLWEEFRKLSEKNANNAYLINQIKTNTFWKRLKKFFGFK